MTVYELIQELLQHRPDARLYFEVDFVSREIECEHCGKPVEIVGETFNMEDLSLEYSGGLTMKFRGDI